MTINQFNNFVDRLFTALRDYITNPLVIMVAIAILLLSFFATLAPVLGAAVLVGVGYLAYRAWRDYIR